EDQERLGRVLQQGPSQGSYTGARVRTCARASDALGETGHDPLRLELGPPGGDGLDLLRRWRARGFQEPPLILTARDGAQDRVTGLDIGADDYLPKPFSLEELLARVRSLVRRQSTVKQVVFEHAGIRLDLLSHTVQMNGQPVDLTSREYALLEVFM